MRTHRNLLLVLLVFLVPFQGPAQDFSEAQKLFAYERWAGAAAGFEKLAYTRADAAYWLVECRLMQGRTAEATAVVRAAETRFSRNPWLLVAQGHIRLQEGDAATAKNLFEQALSAADKTNQASIHLAIGRAHGTVSIKNSDPDYGLDKLRQAALAEPGNDEVYILMGDCYRRKLDGGQAVASYEKALALNPASPRGPYKSGLVYKGQDNCAVLQEKFELAVRIDPRFMPAWRELFNTYSDVQSVCYDMNKAGTCLDKYAASSDPGYETDKLKLQFAYASRDFRKALSEAGVLESRYPAEAATDMLYWKSYIYDKLGDSVAAVKALDGYFAAEKNPGRIDLAFYKFAGAVYGKVPGRESAGMEAYQQYLAQEPDKFRRIGIMVSCAALAEKMNDHCKAGDWYDKIIALKSTATATDYFKAGLAWFRCQNFTRSGSVFTAYCEKFPADWRGPYWAGRSYAVLDSTMERGTAVAFYEKFLDLAATDKATVKMQVEASLYLCAYRVNIKKDKAGGLVYLEKILLLDPQNATALKYRELLQKK